MNPFESPSVPSKGQEQVDYKKKGQQLLQEFQPFFQTFARDVSLQFSLEEAYYIDFKAGKVALDARWFSEKECSSEQIIWAVLHELSHFVDFSRDNTAFAANAEINNKRAKDLADWVMTKNAERANPQARLDRQAIERVARKAYHTFFNVFDDIYVNHLVVERAPAYATTEKSGKEVERLYRTKLFPEKNYTNVPKHLQFLYKLLREAMVPEEGINVDDDVIEALTKTYKVGDKELDALQFIDAFLKPQKKNDATMSRRYSKLRLTFLPLFEALLKKDFLQWIEEDLPQQQEEPFAADYASFDAASPDQVQDEEFQGWVKETKDAAATAKSKAKAKQKKSDGPQAQEARPSPDDAEQERRDRDFLDRFNVDAYAFQHYRRFERDVAPYLDQLSQLWRQIVFGKSVGINLGQSGFFQTGNTLNVGEAIQRWPEISSQGQEKPRVMERLTEQQLEIQRPERINVHLLIDVSTSMNAKKMRVAKQCYVLLMQSLREFSRYLSMASQSGRPGLRVSADAWSFADTATRIKHASSSSLDQEQADIINSFDHIPQALGWTYDDKALSQVNRSISAEDEKRIKQGKQMELIIELTDGVSSNKQATIAQLDALLARGCIARAFQIGTVMPEEERVFESVWQRQGKKMGFVVGERIENVLPALADSLAEFFKQVRV